MATSELLLESLEQRYEKYLAERQRCKKEFSEEAVHDLRVATRRILALIELLRALEPSPLLKKLRRDFKDQLDSLDELRDTQVMLAEISETIAELPELAALQKSLQKREKRLLRSAEDEIKSYETGDITRRIRKIRASLGEPARDGNLAAALLKAMDDAYLAVDQRRAAVDPAQPSTIHRVRVAFKKFRYMVEIIHPMLAGYPETHLDSMHNYQARMGTIQDADVMLAVLADYASRHADYDPQPASRFYEQRRAEWINAFIEDMNEFVTFWRKTPEQPFPWEKPDEPVPDAPRPRRRPRRSN